MTFCKSSVWVCKSLCVCVYVYAWQSGRGSLVTSGAFQSTLGSQWTEMSLRAKTSLFFFTHSTPHANRHSHYGGESKTIFFCYRKFLLNIFILSQHSVTVLITSDSSASQPDRSMFFFRIVHLGECCHINPNRTMDWNIMALDATSFQGNNCDRFGGDKTGNWKKIDGVQESGKKPYQRRSLRE